MREDQKINAIGIKASKDYHPKIGIGCHNKFKRNYIFGSQQKHGKRLQWNIQMKLMIKIGQLPNMHFYMHQ